MNWKELCTEYELELRNGPANSTAATVFTSKTDDGNKRWKDLKVRVVEHVSKLSDLTVELKLVGTWPCIICHLRCAMRFHNIFLVTEYSCNGKVLYQVGNETYVGTSRLN